MTPEQWEQVCKIFEAAAALQPEERSSFLDQACGQDEALRGEVRSLLSLEGPTGDFLGGEAMEHFARILAEENAPSLSGQKLGRYELLSLIGAGGMGEVYRARDLALKRDVAVKVLPSSFSKVVDRLQRFKQEARAASALNHPNIVTVHEVGEIDGCHFIVGEFVEGQTLRERLKRSRMDLNEVLDVATQIAAGLAAAHTVGVIHRDIKPENIMLRPDDYVKILDFGLAKLSEGPTIDLSADARLKTETGVVMGTTRYMSPEQARGLTVDARTDVWSLGVVIYEMLTGCVPFEGQTNSDVVASILEREPAPLSSFASNVPAGLQRIVAKSLRKNREERYQVVKDMLLDLKSLRAGREADSLSQKIRRNKLALALTLGALVLVVAGSAYVARLMYERPGANPQTPPRWLKRATFDAGLQREPTWSPDGRFIAYSSDKGGNFDIWVQPLGGGDAIQITRSPARDWQPNWSPDGNRLVFRSERDSGGLYTVPVLGGLEQKISTFGYLPRWSPDGSKILFTDRLLDFRGSAPKVKLYVTKPGGGEPREVLADFLSGSNVMSFAWHPDGQRITVFDNGGIQTVPLQGGTPVKTEGKDVLPNWGKVPVDMARQADMVGQFCWAPAGDVLYFEGVSQGVRNIWKVPVDPQSLQWRGLPERLTTGIGPDTDITISPDGKSLAFATRVEDTRVWSLPFDARAGKLKGAGQPVTAAGITPLMLDMTRDGKKIVFIAQRTGTIRNELWEKSLEDGRERLLTAREYPFFCPRWSPDGTHLVYQLPRWGTVDISVEPSTVILPVNAGEEQKLTSGKGSDGIPWDWSADGRWVLATSEPERKALVLLPLSAAPNAEAEARLIVSDPERKLFDGRFSPDERWISFVALGGGSTTLYVAPASGGKWVRISEENEWADRARWSPDGRAIYFFSRRVTGFLNVWGTKFDQTKGEPVGDPFQVTFYRGIPLENSSMWYALSADRLALTLTEVTASSIWVLNGVNR